MRRRDAVAVYGDDDLVASVTPYLGRKVIRSDSRYALRATAVMILCSRDEDALELLETLSPGIRNTGRVYISLSATEQDMLGKDNVFVFNLAEITAAEYWKKYPVNHPETITMIGSGEYAEHIFAWGILVNLFALCNGCTYRVVGDFSHYRELHPYIEEVLAFGGDSVEWCGPEWDACLGKIMQSDRVILAGNSGDNVNAVSDLLRYGVSAPIYVRCASAKIAALFPGKRVTVFGTAEEIGTGDAIFHDRVHEDGMMLDALYDLVGVKNEDPDTKRLRDYARSPEHTDSWRRKAPFFRASNYMSAAHDAHKTALLLEHGVDVRGMSFEENRKAYAALPLSVRDELQEIEHDRWCRYYLLHNWQYSPVRNNDERKHPNLVPYSGLDRKTADKDGFAYESLSLRISGTPESVKQRNRKVRI